MNFSRQISKLIQRRKRKWVYLLKTERVLLPPPQVISNEILSRHNVYGVVFDGISSKGKPLYNAIDQKWTPATPTDPGVDTWKDLAPFNVKKCITD